MFIVFGILSILAGCFVFSQATRLSALSNLVASIPSSMVGSFSIVAICLIVSGALLIASKSGYKRGFVKGSVYSYGVASLAAVVNFNYGDLRIWTFVCAIAAVIGFIWLRKNPR